MEISDLTVARFWAKVNKNGAVPEYRPDLGPCWLWTAGTLKGYGRFRVGDKMRKAHRVAYELCVGRVPYGLQLDHLCRVRHCVNWQHLEPVTCAINLARGRHAFIRCAPGTPHLGQPGSIVFS